MACTQNRQLTCFAKARVKKDWFRYFNNHKDFRNEGSLYLFSLMALFSYANFRSNKRHIDCAWYMEAPGQWICKLCVQVIPAMTVMFGAVARLVTVPLAHGKAQR